MVFEIAPLVELVLVANGILKPQTGQIEACGSSRRETVGLVQ